MIKWTIGMVMLSILALALAHIAGRFYDNPWAYTTIVFATNQAAAGGEDVQAIADPNWIEVGYKLCIPATAAAMGADGPLQERTFCGDPAWYR